MSKLIHKKVPAASDTSQYNRFRLLDDRRVIPHNILEKMPNLDPSAILPVPNHWSPQNGISILILSTTDVPGSLIIELIDEIK